MSALGQSLTFHAVPWSEVSGRRNVQRSCGLVTVAPRAIFVIIKYRIVTGVSAMPESREKIEGSCHCGNLRFTFEWPTRGSVIPVRACSCGLCTKHKAV